MNYETLSVTLENHIATVRLNRPAKANAMNAVMWQEIRQVFTWVDATPEARVAVLQGEGRLFTAGIDLQMMSNVAPRAPDGCEARGREALRRVILDKNVVVPDGAQIGVDIESDRSKYTVSPGGIVVLGKGQEVV